MLTRNVKLFSVFIFVCVLFLQAFKNVSGQGIVKSEMRWPVARGDDFVPRSVVTLERVRIAIIGEVDTAGY